MRHWYIYETEHEIQEGAIARCMRGKEVVRCSECRHKIMDLRNGRIVCSYFITDGMEANDFCSRGEFSLQTVKKEIR